MGDRELLELAAKAAGYCMDYMKWDGYRFVEQRVHGVPHCGLNYEKTWNPLADDGDAFRLAVTMKVDLLQYADEDSDPKHACANYTACEDYGDDPYAATRRAIVRAAAQLA